MAELLGCSLGAVLLGDQRRDGLAEGLRGDPGELLATALPPEPVVVVRIPDAAVTVGEDQIQVVVDRLGSDAPQGVDDEPGQERRSEYRRRSLEL